MPKSKSPIDILSPSVSLNLDTQNITAVIIFIISQIITLSLHYAIYTWTEELEKTGCQCSNMWHRNIIHWMALILAIFVVIIMLFRIANITSKAFKAFIVVVFIIGLFYLAMVLDYITKLKTLECQCSESWKRDYGYIYSLVSIIFVSIVLVFSILFGILILNKRK
jgi:predicted membrane channel-forming protein YqfA (hemolysin III family)